MIFVDTSALVKLYLTESGSEEMVALALRSKMAASVLTYAEVHATLARMCRTGDLSVNECAELSEAFEEDWAAMTRLPLDTRTLNLIPDLCTRHPLRASDSVQLASAVSLREGGLDVDFVCSDERLKSAGAAEGFAVVDPTPTANSDS